MPFFRVDELPRVEVRPGLVRRSVYLEHAMLTFFEFAPRSVLPEHNHPHEQITLVMRGVLEFRLDNEIRVLRAGEGVCIPPGVWHGAVVLGEPTFVLDAWCPRREDYLYPDAPSTFP